MAEKKFTELKQMTNQREVSKVFGNLADMRASDPVTLAGAIQKFKRSTIDANQFNNEESKGREAGTEKI